MLIFKQHISKVKVLDGSVPFEKVYLLYSFQISFKFPLQCKICNM